MVYSKYTVGPKCFGIMLAAIIVLQYYLKLLMSLNQDLSHEYQLLQLVSYYSKAILQIKETLDQEKPSVSPK